MITQGPRVGLIGCGRWGRNIARVLAARGALAAIAVRRAEGAADVAATLGVEVTDVGALLAREDIDAVAIAVPPEAHRALVAEALDAGKHVFVEKPLALSTADALALKAVAAAAGKVLMVGHIMRHNPAFARLMEMARAGAVGAIRRATSVRHVPSGGGDPLWLLAPHDASMLLALFGEPMRVEGERLGDQHAIRLTFSDGVEAEIHVARGAAQRHSQLTVTGEAGVLVYEDTAEPARRLRLNDEPIEVADIEPLAAELAAFIRAVEGREAPLTDAAEGVAVVRLLEQAQAQTKSRRR